MKQKGLAFFKQNEEINQSMTRVGLFLSKNYAETLG